MNYRVHATIDIENDKGDETISDITASFDVEAATLILAHNDVRKKLEGVAAITRIDIFSVEELAAE